MLRRRQRDDDKQREDHDRTEIIIFFLRAQQNKRTSARYEIHGTTEKAGFNFECVVAEQAARS